MNEALQATLFDAVQYLYDQGLDYALIGGIAASLRGQPRATADVDLVVAADVERAVKLLRSIATSQFLPLFEGAEQVVEQAFILTVFEASIVAREADRSCRFSKPLGDPSI